VFCQQDRAILCKECDGSIHSANELTKNHTRFLLTGIKLSASVVPYSSSSSSSLSSSSPKKNKNPVLDSSHPLSNPPSTPSPPKPGGNSQTNQEPGFAGSSISEYLINTIPGMKFEDFLDSHSTFACSKVSLFHINSLATKFSKKMFFFCSLHKYVGIIQNFKNFWLLILIFVVATDLRLIGSEIKTLMMNCRMVMRWCRCLVRETWFRSALVGSGFLKRRLLLLHIGNR